LQNAVFFVTEWKFMIHHWYLDNFAVNCWNRNISVPSGLRVRAIVMA